MSQQEIPPWLREQLARLEQLQQNLQAVQVQKQQVEAELAEVDRALDELKTTPEGEQIYKYAGNLLIKVSKDSITKELQERKEVSNTRNLVLGKQETRFKENLKELQTKIDDMLKGRAPQAQTGRNDSS
ncbi:MAG: prefoldin subunit beta [Nitrososphaerota archaeon]|nr:prefoldin subunit beta [Nitrososphaerota archaeon]MDG6966626.1 prefoldin subunit beta [Nitrososphaerota archaeon]MDG6978515.1 prefoldin subunit beta [Nitrososphaerota archaeon]MDG7005967.1 prefoldin subunit beta [Nitrososphaerota archaeon]MDG7022029.1 prefoldin subunit beta [Nitrososphaerota archaeon]